MHFAIDLAFCESHFGITNNSKDKNMQAIYKTFQNRINMHGSIITKKHKFGENRPVGLTAMIMTRSHLKTSKRNHRESS